MFEPDETGYQIVRVLTLGGAVALALALERIRPHARLRPAWKTNIGLWALDTLLMTTLCGACGWVLARWSAGHGLGLLRWLGVEGWAAVVLGLLALDWVSYAWHRANHRIRLLWRFHRVHHADASFHVTTALRFHPGELLLALPVRLFAVLVLGVSPEGLLLFEVVFGVSNLLEHGNFDLPGRVEPAVQRLLITPAIHRAHHVSDWVELDTNFGTVLSIWDRIGGTFRSSDGARRVSTGLPGWAATRAPTLIESLGLPFQRDSLSG